MKGFPLAPTALIAALVAFTAAAQTQTPSTAPGASSWTWQKYKPKSRRDFTGVWDNPDSPAWDPGGSQAQRLTAPLTPEYLAIFLKHQENAKAGRPTGDPTAACTPQGMPRIMTMTFPMEIIQNEVQINIFAEWMEQTRRVFIDGRPMPPAATLDPTYNGYSVGRWNGDVLEIETIGMRGDTNLEASGLPHSEDISVRERMWLETDDLLIDEITLIDPKAFTRPWTVRKRYERMPPGTHMIQYVCLENNRNPVNPDGSIGAILTTEQ